MNVLIVEDEPRMREMLLRALPDMGFSARAAASGEEALRLIERGEPCDAMILDLNLPGMSGLDVLEAVQKKLPGAGVQALVLTGFGDLAAARRAIHLDVVEFLTKPCHLGELETALERARRRWSERQTVNGKPAPQNSVAKPQALTDETGETTRTLDDVERTHILAVLDRHDGNRAAAAAELGISLRTLYYRISEYEKRGHRL